MKGLLGHLRNTVAHGRFTILNDNSFIGFDYQNIKDAIGYNFYIRVDLYRLNKTLNSMRLDDGVMSVLGYGMPCRYVETFFKNSLEQFADYTVYSKIVCESTSTSKKIYDLGIESKYLKQMFLLDVKVIKSLAQSNAIQIESNTVKNRGIPALVLICPSRILSEKNIKDYNEKSVIVLDRALFKKFLGKQDVLTEQLSAIKDKFKRINSNPDTKS